MYGILTYIYPKNDTNVGKYSIHGASGIYKHLWIIQPICRLKDAFHGAEFLDITDGGRGAVGVHVVHLADVVGVSGGGWRVFREILGKMMGKWWFNPENVGKYGRNVD